MIIYDPPRAPESIPLIDVAASFSADDTSRRLIAQQIHRAARETGFFYVRGHGVPETVSRGQLDCARRFFEQPLDVKMELDIAQSQTMRGYEPVALQTLDEGSPPDLKEGFMLARDLPPSHPYVLKNTPYEGANRWPVGLPGFREQIETYEEHMLKLGRHLAALFALSLDLDEGYFVDALEEPSCSIRLLHYPPHPQHAAFNQLGAGAHTDWGFMTMLLQDDAGGLEVRNGAGHWIRADPIPNTFVVNLGDMVPRMTCGLYKSSLHRVLNNTSGRDRYSVPCFFNPGYYYRFDCAPTCRSLAEEPPPTVTFGEHIQEMMRKTYRQAV
jgi:isopenicillin N synthase-like dioxygenase